MQLELKPGDIFLTQNPMWLGKAIVWWQRIWEKDNSSNFSHAGIILNPAGTTLEAYWTICNRNLFNAYKKAHVLVARHEDMDIGHYKTGLRFVKKHFGAWYPMHRLIFHILPPLAKYVSTGKFLVCSELAAKFLVGCGLLEYYKGVTPADLENIVTNYKGWTVVYNDKMTPPCP
jgi:hypothetical protein